MEVEYVHAPSPRFREVLAGLPPFRPSPRPVAPDGTTHLLDANESPHGPLPFVIAAMAGSMAQVHRYPHFGNPNSPTGTCVRRDELERLLDRVPPSCLVLLDEAYREYVRDPAVPDG